MAEEEHEGIEDQDRDRNQKTMDIEKLIHDYRSSSADDVSNAYYNIKEKYSNSSSDGRNAADYAAASTLKTLTDLGVSYHDSKDHAQSFIVMYRSKTMFRPSAYTLCDAVNSTIVTLAKLDDTVDISPLYGASIVGDLLDGYILSSAGGETIESLSQAANKTISALNRLDSGLKSSLSFVPSVVNLIGTLKSKDHKETAASLSEAVEVIISGLEGEGVDVKEGLEYAGMLIGTYRQPIKSISYRQSTKSISSRLIEPAPALAANVSETLTILSSNGGDLGSFVPYVCELISRYEECSGNETVSALGAAVNSTLRALNKAGIDLRSNSRQLDSLIFQCGKKYGFTAGVMSKHACRLISTVEGTDRILDEVLQDMNSSGPEKDWDRDRNDG